MYIFLQFLASFASDRFPRDMTQFVIIFVLSSFLGSVSLFRYFCIGPLRWKCIEMF